MYRECITCPRLGVTCDGPNFVALPAAELLEWCKLRKVHLKMSNAKLAELSGMPKGTLDGLFSGDRHDFRYESIRPVVKALVGIDWASNPCADPHDPAADEHLKNTIKVLESENAKLRQRLEEAETKHHLDLERVKTEGRETIQFLEEQIHYEQKQSKNKGTVLAVLGTVAVVSLVALTVSLLI